MKLSRAHFLPFFFLFSERRTLFYATKWFLIIDYVEMGGNTKGKEDNNCEKMCVYKYISPPFFFFFLMLFMMLD